MPDEIKPKPDGIVSGSPAKPAPFSQDVIYPGAPPVASTAQAITPAGPAAPQAPKADQPSKAPDVSVSQRSEIVVFFCWLAGVFIILSAGWGFIAVCCYLDRWFHLGIPIELAGLAGGLGSLSILFVLERNLWLSRFMGLRLGPHSTQLTETLFFFITGIVGLLLRSTDKPAAQTASSRPPQDNDGIREIIETVVFVVVLVLLLKTFLVEAFVIPTGSMADTLLGYHKDFTCEKCRYPFLVNCSAEAEPEQGIMPQRVIGGFCPNCGFRNVRH